MQTSTGEKLKEMGEKRREGKGASMVQRHTCLQIYLQ